MRINLEGCWCTNTGLPARQPTFLRLNWNTPGSSGCGAVTAAVLLEEAHRSVRYDSLHIAFLRFSTNTKVLNDILPCARFSALIS